MSCAGDCALLIVHHATKGNQSEKKVVDVGAGASAQARSPDCHIALREHDVDDCVVFDAKVRSFRPPEPLVLRWKYPLWHRELLLDPTRLRTGGKSRAADHHQEPEPQIVVDPWTVERFVNSFITEQPQRERIIIDRATLQGLTEREAARLARLAVDAGKAFVFTPPKSNTKHLSTKPQPLFMEEKNG